MGCIIFATAYELDIMKDTSYRKKAGASLRVVGEFISLKISAAKYPYHTKLTIIARRNDFDCMTLADDLRPQSNKSSSILGLAVMLKSGWYCEGSCQLVVLDTLVNKTEQFAER